MKSVGRISLLIFLNLLLPSNVSSEMDFNGLLDMGIHTTIGALGGYIGNRLAKPNMEEKLKLMSVMNESKALN